MCTLFIAKAVCTSVHELGCTTIARIFSKPILSSCMCLPLIAEYREKHGCCGASASLSQKGLEKGEAVAENRDREAYPPWRRLLGSQEPHHSLNEDPRDLRTLVMSAEAKRWEQEGVAAPYPKFLLEPDRKSWGRHSAVFP